MKESGYTLVIIGAKYHSGKWMKWEIERAKQLGTSLKFAVKTQRDNANPSGLPSITSIADEFKLDKIVS